MSSYAPQNQLFGDTTQDPTPSLQTAPEAALLASAASAASADVALQQPQPPVLAAFAAETAPEPSVFTEHNGGPVAGAAGSNMEGSLGPEPISENGSGIEHTVSDSANADFGSRDSESDSEDDDDKESHLKEITYDTSVAPADDKGIDFASGEPIVLSEIKFTKKTITQARDYLRSMGHHKFLDALVHDEPNPHDILLLVKLLGYIPRVKRLKNTNLTLETAIYFLQDAIIKVQKKRARLSGFNTIEQLVAAMEEAKNILVLTGAGISTSLGIPDFRSSKGFYAQMAELGLDDPQDVFAMHLFKKDPSIFYSIAHMILPPEGQYTPLHAFIKLLQDKGKLLRNYTQNIDNLEAVVGIDSDKLVQCHGSFATASCVTCKYKVPGETLFENLRNREIAYCPFCLPERKSLLVKLEKMEDEGIYKRGFDQINSFGVMKPDITFFGEDLPDRFHDTIIKDARECDLLICIGTSLKVAPVSDIVNRISENTPQILINRDPINHSEFDISLLGYCDQAVSWLCGDTKLNWEIPHEDFSKILKSGLEMEVLDAHHGVFSVTDANQRLEQEQLKLQQQIKKPKKELIPELGAQVPQQLEEEPLQQQPQPQQLHSTQEFDDMLELNPEGIQVNAVVNAPEISSEQPDL